MMGTTYTSFDNDPTHSIAEQGGVGLITESENPTMGMYGALTFELIDQLAEATRALEERLAEDGLCTLDRTALQKLDAAKHTAMRLDLERRRTISRLIAGNESAHLTRLQKRIGEQIIQERMERVRAS